MSISYAERRRALPVQRRPARGDDRHLRALRHRLGGRDRGPHRASRQAGGGQPGRAAALHDRVLHAVALGARGDQDRRDGGAGELRAAGRARPQQQAARRQRPGRGAGGRLAVAVRLRPARQRHPPRAAARAGRDPLSHRRRDAHRLPGAARRDERDDRAHQAARPHGRGREAPPAGRPHQDAQPGTATRSRCACRRCPPPSARRW